MWSLKPLFHRSHHGAKIKLYDEVEGGWGWGSENELIKEANQGANQGANNTT